MNPTDALTNAVANWVTMVGQQLNADGADVMRACVGADNADLCVVVRLREGAVILEGTNLEAGQRIELYREDVEPLLGEPRSTGGH
ncbi:MAG TPA: hypothetical protein VI077_11555 [Pseudolabrys sp.]